MTESFQNFAPEAAAAPSGVFKPGTHSLTIGHDQALKQAEHVLRMEADAILNLCDRLDQTFAQAIQLLVQCQGKIVVTGMGKSGHIGNKIAATLASTGSPAFFVHPAELRHGDFGMLDTKDVIIVLSGSGETQEIKLVLDPIKRLGLPIIAFTGNLDSTLAKHSNAVIYVGVEREACPLNLAPTSSTTAALAMGDALAIVLMTVKGFKADDFARSHPGGNLGQQLVTVSDVMRSGMEIPVVRLKTVYQDIVAEIDQKRLGFTCVVTEQGSLCGIITDGDIRRTLVRWEKDAFQRQAHELMTADPKTISSDSLAVEALKIMETHAISDLLILDHKQMPVGVIHLKDLLKAGIV